MRLPVMQRLGAHRQDAVCIDFEVDINFEGASFSRRDVSNRVVAQRVVLGGSLALALPHVNLDLLLIIPMRLIFLCYIERNL